MKSEKEIAKDIYDRVVNEGKSTDYFYSPDFDKMAKEKAINRASSLYSSETLEKIIEAINSF